MRLNPGVEMSYRGSITYKKPTTRTLEIDGFELRTTRVNTDISRVYFWNNNEIVQIPAGFRMVEWFRNPNTGQWTLGPVNVPVGNMWFISWQGSYRIYNADGEEIIRLTNQKQQSLSVHDSWNAAITRIVNDDDIEVPEAFVDIGNDDDDIEVPEAFVDIGNDDVTHHI